LDGIAALLFEDMYPLAELEKQVKELIELFAPRLILGISDEISSGGDIERIKFVGKIVDDYNASV
jgi:Fe-S cluster assembly ATPase SufC